MINQSKIPIDLKKEIDSKPKVSEDFCDKVVYENILKDPYDIYLQLKDYILDFGGYINLEDGINSNYRIWYNPECLKNDYNCGFDIGDTITVNNVDEFVVFEYPKLDYRVRDWFKYEYASKYIEAKSNIFWIISRYVLNVEAYGIDDGKLCGYELSGDDWKYNYTGHIDPDYFLVPNIKKISPRNPIIELISETIKQYGVTVGENLFMYLYHNGINMDLTGQTKSDIDHLLEQVNKMISM